MTDALQGLSDASRTGKREQTVLTGQPITDLLRAFWGDTCLDPCAPPPGPVRVECDYRVTRGGKRMHPDDCRHCGGQGWTLQTYDLDPEYAIRLPHDGRLAPWPDRTFCNPPYSDLRSWFIDTAPDARVLWYVPSRPHRRWYRAWAATLTDLIALNPQRFRGYTAAFPAPLVLGYRGPRDSVPLLRQLVADADLGESMLAPHERACTL